MKKKIKDLTLGEITKICYGNSCIDCPLNPKNKLVGCSFYLTRFEDVLDKEVKINE